MIGDRFGRLTVVGGPTVVPTPSKGRLNRRRTFYACRCDCGKEISVESYQLRSGETKSCGCLRNDKARERAKVRNFRHGLASDSTRPPEYHVWIKMRSRCHDSNDKDYARWGARGISVCDRWRESFVAFYEDMGSRPTAQHQIDRINNEGPYSPENCRWATAKEQAANRRSTVFLEHDGRRLPVAEWSREMGVGSSTIFYRINAGWPVAEALRRPTNYRRKPK